MQWSTVPQQDFQDILYQHAEGIAKITIYRPDVHKAFRPETVQELIRAFTHAHLDDSIGAIILTGAMKAAFNADTDGLAGIQELAGNATAIFYMTDEAKEGRDAFLERPVDFSCFPRRP